MGRVAGVVRSLGAAAAIAAAVSAAFGNSAAAEPVGGFISEIRLGAQYHDAAVFNTRRERGWDVSGEFLFVSPRFLEFAFAPRPHLGFHANTAGDTSQVYFGLSWEATVWQGLFVGFSLGGSVHDGVLRKGRIDRQALGTRVLFRESVEIGYRFAGGYSISVMFDHVSNARLASSNQGLDTLGARLGYSF